MTFRTPEKLREQPRNPEDGVDAFVAERLNQRERTEKELAALQGKFERMQAIA